MAEGDRVYGRVVETPAFRLLGLSDVGRRATGRLAPGPAEDAGAAIDAASELLAREGFSFRDVARTWFYLRDILDWYGPFNAVRNAAFRRMGLVGPGGDGQIPASTGIEGRNPRGGWCTLDLLALAPRDGARVEMRRLHNRRQNEATEYGSAFARAMEVVLGDARYVFVSGTASIDDHGATVHVGDFETQTRYTLEAVEALLEGAGARLSDVGQATAFLANPCDGRAFERIVEPVGPARGPPRDHRRRRLPERPALRDRRRRGRAARPRGAAVTVVRPGPALALVLVVAPTPTSPAERAEGRPPAAPIVVAQVPVGGTAPAALAGGTLRAESGEGGRLVLVSPNGKPRVLTAAFHSAADPEVSFDGGRFSSRRRRWPRIPGASSR